MQRPFAFPGARPRYAPDRFVDVEHYAIHVHVIFDERRIEGTCALTIRPILEGVTRLELDAVEMQIEGVLADGVALQTSYDGKRLVIRFPEPLAAGSRHVVTVAYAATPRRGLYFIGPDEGYPQRRKQVWSQGQDEDSRHWFPCFDAPNQKSTTEVVATVPEPFFALSNGDLADVARDGHEIRYHWKLDIPHSCYLVTLAAGELTEIRDEWNGVAVRYYVEPGREDDAHRALGKTPQMLECFSSRFGVKYPYHSYSQVCVADFIFGGMENTTATTLTDSALFDARAALDYDMESLVAHELAHQWFGDLVTCRDWGQGWLNEGFATYSEYIWREWGHSRDEAQMELRDWRQQYFDEDHKRYRRPIATNVYDEPIEIFDHHLYEKGGLVLHMLRGVLGDAPFWRTLAHYLEKHRAQVVETRDLARAVEAATGRGVDWFFEQWIEKAGHPEIEVSYGWDDEKRHARLSVKQKQKVENETPLFRLPLSVRFRVAGADRTFDVDIKDTSEVFFFPLSEAPTQAIFDTGQSTLMAATVDKSVHLWLAELAGASDAADRMAAADGLEKQSSPEVIGALSRALTSDPFWGVRAVAAGVLGQIRTAAARDALIAALDVDLDLRARRAVVKALGDFKNDEIAAAALEAIVVAGDKSLFVEGEACLALGRTRSPRAREALRVAAARDSYLDVVRGNAFRGLAEARDDSAIPLLLEGSAYGKLSQGRRAAVQALATLAQGRTDLAARDARERIETLLDDVDFRVAQSALEALGKVAEPRSLPALHRAVDTHLDGRIRRRGREVIRDLEEGRSRDEATKLLRDEVDRLRQELVGMRERLAALDAARSPRQPVASPPAAAKPRPAKSQPKRGRVATPSKKRATLKKSRPRR